MRLAAIWRALETVFDPEIPILNVVEMGIIADVQTHDDIVQVCATPTFAGCPAIAVIRSEIEAALRRIGYEHVQVTIVYDPPWTSDRMTVEGRRKLKEFGLAPPGPSCVGTMPNLDKVRCPYCDSRETELESMFGPTLCRSIHYCHACLQSFEHFKPV